MTKYTDRAFSRGRGLGSGVRFATLVPLLLSGVIFGIEASALLPLAVFWLLLILPRDFPLFVALRRLNPTAAYGILALAFMFLFPLGGMVAARAGLPSPLIHALAYPLMLYLAWKMKAARLGLWDHRVLLAGSLALVLLSYAGEPGPMAVPLFVLWVIAAVVALVRVQLKGEEQRVANLARLRGHDRESGDEISGRETVRPVLIGGALAQMVFWVLVGGLLLALATPYAALGVKTAWIWLVVSDDGEEGPAMPEAGPGTPEFKIPPGVAGFLPFGPRLERDEFRHRREAEGIALLMKPGFDGSTPGSRMLVRGECYDFLTSDGRWIQSRAAEREILDADDGNSNGYTSLPDAPFEVDIELEYLIPPGPDRTYYALAAPVAIAAPSVVIDGTGNVRNRGGRSPQGKYSVRSRELGSAFGGRLAHPGPEFLLLPEDVDANRLAREVRTRILDPEDPFYLVLALRDWLRGNYLRWDEFEPPAEGEEPAPARLDVEGFLFDRRWGGVLDFATAYAMVLRSVGIPCRLATGYRDGDWIADAGFWVFRANRTYAWVEVPFEGYGWVPLDPAADEIGDLDDEERREVFERPPEERAEEAKKALEKKRRPTLIQSLLDKLDGFISSLLPGDRRSSALGRVISWLILIGVFAFLFRAALFLAGRGRQFVVRRRSDPARARSMTFYERLLRVLERHGMRRKRTQTPLEFARAVVRTLGPDLDDVGRLTNAFCAHRYGSLPLSRDASKSLLARVGQVEAIMEERARRRRARVPATVAVLLVLALGGVSGAQEPADHVRALGDPMDVVRREARMAILSLGRAALPALTDALVEERPAELNRRIAALILELDADDFLDRERASRLLRAVGPPARPALEAVLETGSAEAVNRATAVLAYFEGEGGVRFAREREVDAVRRRQALYLLGKIGGQSEVDPVAQTGLARGELRSAAVDALAEIAKRALPSVLSLLDRGDPELRRLAIDAIIQARLPAARPRLLRLVQEGDMSIRSAAAAALLTARAVEDTDRARLLIARFEPEEAENLLRSVLRSAPGYAEAGLLLISLIEDRADALAVAEGLVLPEARHVILTAELMADTGDREAALTRLAGIGPGRPGHLDALLLSAKILLLADPPRAATALDKATSAVNYAEKSAEAWALVGRIQGEFLDDAAAALEAYDKAMMLDIDNREYRLAVIEYMKRR